MRYSSDGKKLGYIWQVHPDFDPFANWREYWAENKRQKAQLVNKQNHKVKIKRQDPYGYGLGKYQGD